MQLHIEAVTDTKEPGWSKLREWVGQVHQASFFAIPGRIHVVWSPSATHKAGRMRG